MDLMTASTGDVYPATAAHSHHFSHSAHGRPLRKRTLNHQARRATKQFCLDHPGDVPCRTHGIECRFRQCGLSSGNEDASSIRHHAQVDFKYAIQSTLHHDPASHSRRSRRPNHRSWTIEEDDVLDLARGDDPLPGDGRLGLMQRHPSLEREDAFCDATTFKRKVQVKPMPGGSGDEDAQIAELYRMGLLYDEAERQGHQHQQRRDGATFNLNDIRHDEPVYSVRPPRRSRNRAAKPRAYDGPLPLNLSFADLGDDNDLARYLSPRSPAPAADGSGSGGDKLQHASSRRASAPLRVIYELATSRPSFDVDTSQPPDLMDDSLSDYDYFSDSDLDDAHGLPSQTEVPDAANATSASGPWVLLGDDSQQV